MNICILDNFDSFTFNLLEEFKRPGFNLHIWRNSIKLDELKQKMAGLSGPKLLVLSPGPGHPDDAGCMNQAIKDLAGIVPIFGVCLGMQAMVSVFGGKVSRAPKTVHGKAKILKHDGSEIFFGLKNNIAIGRYHSLAATTVPEDFRVLGSSEAVVMAISHKTKPLIGIQFHPESLLTTHGSKMIENIVIWAEKNQ